MAMRQESVNAYSSKYPRGPQHLPFREWYGYQIKDACANHVGKYKSQMTPRLLKEATDLCQMVGVNI
jgi:hypothetical protein